MSTPGRVGVCFECLPLVNNRPHCGMMDFILFGNGHITLPRLMAATIASLRSLLMSYLQSRSSLYAVVKTRMIIYFNAVRCHALYVKILLRECRTVSCLRKRKKNELKA